MINIGNTQEDKIKLSDPNAQRVLEREKRKKRKSKVFYNLDEVIIFQ